MTDLSPKAWEQKYSTDRDPWNYRCPAPPFENLLDSSLAPKPGRMAVLGCGTGHDAMLFARSGFNVTGFDFAANAIASATKTAQARKLEIEFLQRNIFELEREFQHSFDYVLEHTCFCAIDPKLRSQYVEVVHNLLVSSGQLIALFYTDTQTDGLPFGTEPEAILDYFSPYFDIVLFEAAKDSIARSQGKEHLAIFQRRSL